ncbi:MAG TPA: tetratricopeptide repeat protein [Gammaproteobacteria bacterium]
MRDFSVQQAFAVALESHRGGRLAEAERGYRHVLARCPDHSDALHFLGVIALQTDHLEPALALIERAIALAPDAAPYHNNRGLVLERLRRDADARAAYETAIALDPRFAEPLNNLGHLLMRSDALAEAEACFRNAIEIDPDYAEPRVNLGNLQKDRGELDEAIASYRRAIELRPDLSSLHSNLLLTLHYHAECSPEELAREHRRWAERHVAPLIAERREHANAPDPDRRLRIGYVSPDFREHSVARFILPILGAHDRASFEVFAYADLSRPDATTEAVKERVDGWRETYALTDADLARRVREDRIDILVDLAAHSGRNRLLVFARKPAPVQVTYLGYCSTTGVDAIDYRLTDRFLDPPGTDLSLYSERSIRLPDCYWCYPAPRVEGDEPPIDRRPGPPTFGCLNNFAKVTPATLRLWARLLLRVPEARLLLHARAGDQCRAAAKVLHDAGIDESRIRFVGRQPFRDYLATYRDIDVTLDPFPFGGGTTTCDALWMGVPVVTLTGRTPVSRAGSSLLANAGLSQWIADTEGSYVDIAEALMRERDQVAARRPERRALLERSPVMDLPRFVRHLEAAYRSMWSTWCAQRRGAG